eukprot:SAG31_NODE_4935_length_2851_cov_2.089753_1_plen_154_part_00
MRRNTEIEAEQMKLVITVLYGFGGVLFVVGSVYFLPVLKDPCPCLMPAGGWLFFVGSLFYIFGALLNVQKVGIEEKKHVSKTQSLLAEDTTQKSPLRDTAGGLPSSDELVRARSDSALETDNASASGDGNILSDFLFRQFSKEAQRDDIRHIM